MICPLVDLTTRGNLTCRSGGGRQLLVCAAGDCRQQCQHQRQHFKGNVRLAHGRLMVAACEVGLGVEGRGCCWHLSRDVEFWVSGVRQWQMLAVIRLPTAASSDWFWCCASTVVPRPAQACCLLRHVCHLARRSTNACSQQQLAFRRQSGVCAHGEHFVTHLTVVVLSMRLRRGSRGRGKARWQGSWGNIVRPSAVTARRPPSRAARRGPARASRGAPKLRHASKTC